MGSSSSRPQQSPLVVPFDPAHWEFVEELTFCNLYYNRPLNINAECYELPIQQLSKELSKYENRKMDNPLTRDIVWIYCITLENNDYLCSPRGTFKLFTQRIPLRLDQIYNISQDEFLGVLRAAYSGYGAIATYYGAVLPTQRCIGFNEAGKTKVWLNQKFEINVPQSIPEDQNQSFKVRQSVAHIFNMVAKHAINLNPVLRRNFQKYTPTYAQAVKLIDQYAEKYKIRISHTLGRKHTSLSPQKEKEQLRSYSFKYQFASTAGRLPKTKMTSLQYLQPQYHIPLKKIGSQSRIKSPQHTQHGSIFLSSQVNSPTYSTPLNATLGSQTFQQYPSRTTSQQLMRTQISHSIHSQTSSRQFRHLMPQIIFQRKPPLKQPEQSIKMFYRNHPVQFNTQPQLVKSSSNNQIKNLPTTQNQYHFDSPNKVKIMENISHRRKSSVNKDEQLLQIDDRIVQTARSDEPKIQHKIGNIIIKSSKEKTPQNVQKDQLQSLAVQSQIPFSPPPQIKSKIELQIEPQIKQQIKQRIEPQITQEIKPQIKLLTQPQTSKIKLQKSPQRQKERQVSEKQRSPTRQIKKNSKQSVSMDNPCLNPNPKSKQQTQQVQKLNKPPKFQKDDLTISKQLKQYQQNKQKQIKQKQKESQKQPLPNKEEQYKYKQIKKDDKNVREQKLNRQTSPKPKQIKDYKTLDQSVTHEDIEAYIRQKYLKNKNTDYQPPANRKKQIGAQKLERYGQYVDKYKNQKKKASGQPTKKMFQRPNLSARPQKEISSQFGVMELQQKLDRKFRLNKFQAEEVKKSGISDNPSDDMLNVANLDKKLKKFEESRVKNSPNLQEEDNIKSWELNLERVLGKNKQKYQEPERDIELKPISKLGKLKRVESIDQKYEKYIGSDKNIQKKGPYQNKAEIQEQAQNQRTQVIKPWEKILRGSNAQKPTQKRQQIPPYQEMRNLLWK